MSVGQGFLTGLMGTMAQNIGERKQEARDYFNQQLQLAHKTAYSLNNKYKAEMDASLQVAKQLMAVGVPEKTVMAIANQNPDDLPLFYETIQKLQVNGVDTTNPQFYEDLIQVDGEINAGDENITSLLTRIYQPLSNNVKADPEGFKFDPKGTIWATAMGYNAMDRAMQKLETTPVMGGSSAADILRMEEAGPNVGAFGDATVTMNANMIGNETRAARERLSGEDGLQTSEINAILNTFGDMVKEELGLISAEEDEGLSPSDRDNLAKRRAAVRVLENYPNAALVPDIRKWLQAGEETVGETVEEAPAVQEETTVTPPVETTIPTASIPLMDTSPLPSGAQFIKDNGDGTSDWSRNGSITTYKNSDVNLVKQGQAAMKKPSPATSTGPRMREQPTPGWLFDLGSEYDK